MKILAIDTVTEACSVALSIDKEIEERFELSGNGHSSILLDQVRELLASAEISLSQLDAIAFDRGPGSFTGLRIGAGVAQGLAFTGDVPLIAESSLEVLAMEGSEGVVLPAIDARMQQVYWAVYRLGEGRPEVLVAEALSSPEAVECPQSAIGLGSGWSAYSGRLAAGHADYLEGCYPRAKNVARLSRMSADAGLSLTPERGLPVYIRDNIVQHSTLK